MGAMSNWTLSRGRDMVSHATNYCFVSRPPVMVLARIVFVFPACRSNFGTAPRSGCEGSGVCRECFGVCVGTSAVRMSHVRHLRRMIMNRTTFIRSMQSKKRKRNPSRKPKIRWEVLGLSGPQGQGTGESASIDSIRQAVSSMASRGLGQGTRSRMKSTASEDVSQSRTRGIRRRGATE